MDIYLRKKKALEMARELITDATTQGEEVDIEKLIYAVVNEHAVPEGPLRKGINTYIEIEEGISIHDGTIKKEA